MVTTTKMPRSGRWLLLMLALALLALATPACAWDDGDEADEEEEDDDDGFDFLSATLDAPAADAFVEVSCSSDDPSCAFGEDAVVKSAAERGLITTKPSVAAILREHGRAAPPDSGSAFGGEVFGYVTPWNARGYDFARAFRTKLDFVSPVWLQVREDADRQPIITGTHDIDAQWASDVRGSDGRGPAIVPRVMYERNSLSESDVQVIIDSLLALADEHSFQGFVFEIPIVPGTMDLLTRVGDALQGAGKLLILVLQRASNEGALAISDELFRELAPRVHRFTMNAYDFQTPGPNAPLPWVQSALDHMDDEQRAKILMGLPFYGYDNRDAITSDSYIAGLRDNNVAKIRWDAKAHECRHEFTRASDKSRHVVYFPCLQFLYDRLELFNTYGVGVAVWELGQGLEYFYDLL